MEFNVASIFEAIASRYPDRDCIVFGERRFSWSDTNVRTHRLASVLSSTGLGRPADRDPASNVAIEGVDREPGHNLGDRVALYLLNGNEYLEGMLGAWKAGCVPFNVNYRYVAEELTYLLNDAGTSALIVHERFTPVLNDVLDELETPPSLILTVSDGSGHGGVEGSVDYETALAAAEAELPSGLVESWSGDDVYLCYTGGTTGMPKGAIWRQGDFLVAALGVRHRNGVEFASLDEVVNAARGTVRALPAPPLMHGAAHWNALSCWIAGGAVIIQSVVDRFDAADVLSTAAQNRATSLLIVGDSMARPLVDTMRSLTAKGSEPDLSGLRHILSGGAVLSSGLKKELLDLWNQVRIVDVLGSTESGRQAMSSVSAGGDVTAGFAPSGETSVLSEDLSRVLEEGDEETGWLARSDRVPIGYMNDPVKTARTFPVIDGIRYAIPGDRARFGPDGLIELLGRDSVCINTGGEKVFAEEVETAVKAHRSVLDVVVCGRPSERFGSEVVAIVKLRGDVPVDDAELRATAARHIARYKLPRQFIRMDEIVRSPSGKADYRWAAAEAAKFSPSGRQRSE